MHRRGCHWLAIGRGLLVGTALVASACAAPTGSGSIPAPQATQGGATPHGSITIAFNTEPDQLISAYAGTPTDVEARWIFSSYLTYTDADSSTHPMLAREIPTQEGGDWVVNPDGTMVTTYRLRENARWHDGVPITADDFVFAYRVISDPTVPTYTRSSVRLISNVEAPDDHTLVITWRQPYVYANVLSSDGLQPLPRHQLETKYLTDPAQFPVGDEWTNSFIGSGPFRVERWDPGVRIMARAFTDWVLGPPRLDTLEIRFMPDPNAVLTGLLSGDLDFAMTPTIRIAEATVARDQWVARGDGYLQSWAVRLRYVEYQYREVPNWQRATSDIRIRQALEHAIDRQGLVDVMTDGFGQIGDAWVQPSDPHFAEISGAITKYPFDPQRATALLGEAGWSAQPGGLLTNAAGQTLDLEINNQSQEPDLAVIIANDWRQIGINSSVFVLPASRANDVAFRKSFPGAALGEGTASLDGFSLSSTAGRTRGTFKDPEVDRLYDLAVSSFDESERVQSEIAMNQRLSEQASYGPLYYTADVLLAKNRVKGPAGEVYGQSGVTWNIFQWEVTD